ncbi:Cadmium-induced protein ZinT [Providencia rettgeri]|nr:Cadmium-induced protein ZinT [Providencia rettgeri]
MYKMAILKTSLYIALALTSYTAAAHGSHSHSHPQSEKALQASKGIFEDTDVKDRSLSDWQGIWESVNPLLLNGKLDEVLESKAKKNKDKTVEEYREYYKKGYATDVDSIGIENDVIEFTQNGTVSSCKYDYAGYKILHYTSGKKAFVTYLNAKMQTQKRLNLSSLVTILLNHKPRGIFTYIWEMNLRKNY